jgi:hypothetical protein
MAASSQLNRPRSLVSHLMHLSGADPVTARMLLDSSGKAAIKRLGIRPAVKARTKTTARDGRHITLVDRETGEKRRARRRHSVPVYRYTFPQAAAVIADMNPRKKEYQALQETALANVSATFKSGRRRMRMLPRHSKWSKRRHRR